MLLLNRLAEPILYHICNNKLRCCSCMSAHRMLLRMCMSQIHFPCSNFRRLCILSPSIQTQLGICSMILKRSNIAMKHQQSLMAQFHYIQHLLCLKRCCLNSGIGEEARMCLYPHSICSRDSSGRHILSRIQSFQIFYGLIKIFQSQIAFYTP